MLLKNSDLLTLQNSYKLLNIFVKVYTPVQTYLNGNRNDWKPIYYIFNRRCAAGAVLQSPLLLIDWVSQSSFSSKNQFEKFSLKNTGSNFEGGGVESDPIWKKFRFWFFLEGFSYVVTTRQSFLGGKLKGNTISMSFWGIISGC